MKRRWLGWFTPSRPVIGWRSSLRLRDWGRRGSCDRRSPRCGTRRVDSPWRPAPSTASFLPARLAHALGSRSPGTTNPVDSWRALEQAVRVCALQGFQVVLAVDRGPAPVAPGEVDELQRLVQLGGGAGRVTVVLVADEEWTEASSAVQAWTLAIRLRPLSCSETEFYLGGKLAAAGCHEAIFTSRAVSRLHVHSAGNPRGVDRLASLALIAGASRGLEAISSELVDSSSRNAVSLRNMLTRHGLRRDPREADAAAPRAGSVRPV